MRRALLTLLMAPLVVAQSYDIVIRGGRVIDPESKLDAVREVGITGGKIRAVSTKPLAGRAVIDARPPRITMS